MIQKIILTTEQQKLAANNYRLVADFVKKSIETYKIPFSLRDDFVSNSSWRLCISALKFEEDRGFKFSTFAYGGFKFSLQAALSETLKYKEEMVDEYDEETEEDDWVDTRHEFRYDFLNEFIENSTLKEREKRIITDRYCNNMTLSDIGEKYGFTKQNANYIIPKIIDRLKKNVIHDDLEMDDFYK